MNYRETIYDYIKTNQPVTRRKIITDHPSLSDKTIYSHINALIRTKRIVLKDGEITTSDYTDAGWPIHSILKKFGNYSCISNAFAENNPTLKLLTNQLAKDYGPQLSILISDLTMLLAVGTPDQEELRKAIAVTYPTPKEVLEQHFQKLTELISNYPMPKDQNNGL